MDRLQPSPAHDQQVSPLPSKSRSLKLPSFDLKTGKLKALLAIRKASVLERSNPKDPFPKRNETSKNRTIFASLQVRRARAGPSKEMKAAIVIDLTSDDDEQRPVPRPAPFPPHEDNIYNADSSEGEIEEIEDVEDEEEPIFVPEPPPQANIIPDMNDFAAHQQAAPQQLPAFIPIPLVPNPNQQAIPPAPFGDYIDDLISAEEIDQAFAQIESESRAAPIVQPANANRIPVAQPQSQEPEPISEFETKAECIESVQNIFQGICTDHVSELFDKVAQTSVSLIQHILDKQEKGTPYPKAKDSQKTLKRKREVVDDDEAAEKKYCSPGRVVLLDSFLRAYITKILQYEFPETPMTFIHATCDQSQYRLFQAYRVLQEAQRTFDPVNPPYNKIKSRRKAALEFNDASIQAYITTVGADPSRVEVHLELQAARRIRRKAEAKREAELLAEQNEKANEERAQVEGTMQECGCCFGDYPLNRMVHCDADTLHWFCKSCTKQTADTEIGNSKYILRCMSMDGCEGGFSADQRSIFLDKTRRMALERNEQEACLRNAGIENLESCPFCPYAAEYPPVEVDKEFRCNAPDCEKVSCRMCKLESHIPKSCDEFAKENGLSIRRQIEEAMSAALIRKCNKCATPFVKEEGCNKMTCTRNGCRNVQCYVCSKSCSYDHFDDSSRGGKKGNCPLFESTSVRHDTEVQKAEKEALDRVRAEHPEYTEEDLKVKMSENVRKDDEVRKSKDPRGHLLQAHAQAQVVGRHHAARVHMHPRPPMIPVLNRGEIHCEQPVNYDYLHGGARIPYQQHWNQHDDGMFAGLFDGFGDIPPRLPNPNAQPAAVAAPFIDYDFNDLDEWGAFFIPPPVAGQARPAAAAQVSAEPRVVMNNIQPDPQVLPQPMSGYGRAQPQVPANAPNQDMGLDRAQVKFRKMNLEEHRANLRQRLQAGGDVQRYDPWDNDDIDLIRQFKNSTAREKARDQWLSARQVEFEQLQTRFQERVQQAQVEELPARDAALNEEYLLQRQAEFEQIHARNQERVLGQNLDFDAIFHFRPEVANAPRAGNGARNAIPRAMGRDQFAGAVERLDPYNPAGGLNGMLGGPAVKNEPAVGDFWEL